MTLFSDKQREFIDSADHRWNIQVGATRSGKTYVGYFMIPKRIRNRIGKEGLSVILGVSKNTIERNVLEPMRNMYGSGLVGGISSNNTCHLFGETVHCLGAEKVSQVSKLRGASIKYCYGDEVADWNPEVFELLKSRLDKTYSCFDGALNPESPNHWLKEFIDSDADIFNQQYTIFDNPFLSQEFIDNLCAEYAGTVYYDRYILGKWALAEGLIYPMYQDAIVDSLPDINASQYVVSIDYGTMNAFSAILWSKRGDVWYGEREYYYSGRDTGVQKTDQEYMDDLNEWIEDIWEWIQENPVRTIYGPIVDKIQCIIDPSASSFIALLKKQKWAKVRQADNSVLDGIRETAVALKMGRVKILRPSMPNWIKEAGGYVWDDSEGEERPIKIDDHAMDASRYFVKTMRLVTHQR